MNKFKFESNNLPPSINTWFELLTSSAIFSRELLSTSSANLELAFQAGISLESVNVLTSHDMGGLNLNLAKQCYYHRNLARISTTLAFLCAQHSGAMSLIANGSNTDLKDVYLKNNLNGEYSFGISFAHLRNVKNPTVIATETTTSYHVKGILPYVTGYKIFNMLLVGFVCGDKEIFALTDFIETNTLKVIKTLDLVTATSTNTVMCELNNHIIDKSTIIKIDSIGTLTRDNDKRLRHVIAYTIGLAFATFDLIAGNHFLEISDVNNTYLYLFDKLIIIENELINLPEGSTTIPTRIKALELISKIFLFADQIFKGQATISNHPLVLIKREAEIIAASASNIQTLVETCKLLLK